MTLNEISALEKEMLNIADVAEFLGTDAQTIRVQAQTEPERLGFPVIITGRRVKIPRDAFVFFCRYGRPIMHDGAGWH